jgi:hypothetical protein
MDKDTMKTSFATFASVLALVSVAAITGCATDIGEMPPTTAPAADAGTTPPADSGPTGPVCGDGVCSGSSDCYADCRPPTPPADAGTTCLPGAALCDGQCRDLQNNVAHCGACGRTCATGQSCNAGVCTSPTPRPCGRDTMDVTLPPSFHTICPGGMSVVVHGIRQAEDVNITSDGQSNPAFGVARYFGSPGVALSLSLSPGLWAGQEIRISGMCARTGAWAEAGTIRLWERHANAGAAGARIVFNGVDLANTCRVASQPFGESAYPSCWIPQPNCR